MWQSAFLNRFVQALALAICIGGFGCSSSDDAEPNPGGNNASDGGDAGEEASTVECVLGSGGTCPHSCIDLTGWPLDKDNSCRYPEAVIGCAPDGSGFPDEEGCYVEIESGTVYATPGLYLGHLSSAYRECTDEEREFSYKAENACE